jgi:hypothetical protein
VELKTHGVGGEGMADSRVHLIFDALLRRAALVVEGDDALRRAGAAGDDEADARVKLTRSTLATPRLGLLQLCER